MTWRGVALFLAYVPRHLWFCRAGDFFVFEGWELPLSINDCPVRPVGHHFDCEPIGSGKSSAAAKHEAGQADAAIQRLIAIKRSLDRRAWLPADGAPIERRATPRPWGSVQNPLAWRA